MATNSTAPRGESRRRKILERGADRLALITGRTEILPSESYHPPDADSSHSQPHRQDPPPHLSDQITASPNVGDGGFSSILPTNDSIIDSGQGGDIIEPLLHTLKTSIETSKTPPDDVGSNEQSSLVSSTDQRSTTPTLASMQHLEQLHPSRFVTPNQISSAIASTESQRLFCSVTIALFVVLSYLGFPLLGGKIIRSTISFRPLYLVLLTNLTLVFARLLFNNQRGFVRIVGGENNIPSTSKNDWAELAGKTLEVGLVMQKAIDAVLIDCSIYVLIVISGLSFL